MSTQRARNLRRRIHGCVVIMCVAHAQQCKMALRVVFRVESRASVAPNKLLFGTTSATWSSSGTDIQQSSQNRLPMFRPVLRYLPQRSSDLSGGK